LTKVNLQPITNDNRAECVSLKVSESQTNLVASNETSLIEANNDPTLIPLAVYDISGLGHLPPHMPAPMVGFVMLEIKGGVGCILRLLIDRDYQGQGYGKAAMIESIRRLKLYPDVQLIVTSHRRKNEAVANLYKSLGFVSWDIEWARADPDEVYLQLKETME
jgi:diamine N-acetyltransferase